jgi:alkylation response protein AidB-like acyl-CoA dehydrogenase
VRDRLSQLFIESEIFRVTNLRGLTKIMKKGVPGPEGSLGKWHWAEINQHLMELAMEIEGPYSQFADGSEYSLGGDWQYQFLRTRANSIEGGTTDILRNIVAERVLGLPKLR